MARTSTTTEAARVKAIYDALAAAIDPKSDLAFHSPFELLVAVVLSAQATDKSVNLATAKLFPVANTPAQILALGTEGLESHIKTIGLYRSKARHLLETCRILIDQHDGEVPRSREALEALPGVGRKTANVVLNVAFGEPTMAVDTHIFRVSNRTGLAPGRTPLAVEQQLDVRVPAAYRQDAHHWLILHGLFENPAVVGALFGRVPPPLEAAFDRLADVVDAAFTPAALMGLLTPAD